MKTNCWEYTNCGRQLGGSKVKELGVCPASVETKLHGVNNGKNGGRSCWAVTATLCNSQKQGNFSLKINNCMNCGFYKKVFAEEFGGLTYKSPADIIKVLKS